MEWSRVEYDQTGIAYVKLDEAQKAIADAAVPATVVVQPPLETVHRRDDLETVKIEFYDTRPTIELCVEDDWDESSIDGFWVFVTKSNYEWWIRITDVKQILVTPIL